MLLLIFFKLAVIYRNFLGLSLSLFLEKFTSLAMKAHVISAKILSLFLLLATPPLTSAQSDKLSNPEKLDLLKKLEEIRNAAEKSSKDRFGTAMKAFREAVRSDVAAHELYLKCVEKVNFEDQKRSSQDFREWKRSHKERSNTQEFRRALQHQLSWLLLSIEASAKPDEIQSLGRSALDRVDAIMEDHEMLKPHRGILQQPVLSSVFARAYDIHGLEAEDWPKSPLNIADIYDKLILPPLSHLSSVDKLRSAWDKRIQHEGLILKNWGTVRDDNKIGMKEDSLPIEYIKWQEEEYPELLWKKEMECYMVGDQKQAAANMLKHINKFIKHKQSLSWTSEFQSLMSTGSARSESENLDQDSQ